MTTVDPLGAPDASHVRHDVAVASSSAAPPAPALSQAMPPSTAAGEQRGSERTVANIPPTIKSAGEALPLVELLQRLSDDGGLEPTEPFTRLRGAFENWSAHGRSLPPGEPDLCAGPVLVYYPWAYTTLASTTALPPPAVATAAVPAPWAQPIAVISIGGVLRPTTTSVPWLRERIAHWQDALLLNAVIEDVPMQQRTVAMTDLRTRVGARRALESATRGVDQLPAPAELAALEDAIVKTYPTAYADTRTLLDTPERMRVLTAMRDESFAHARAAIEGELAPSNDAEPQPCATETDDVASAAESAAFPSTARIAPQGVAGPSAVEFHSLAELFPLIVGLDFDELVESVRKNGLVEPIILYEGQILDGRNRHRACLAAGVEPRFETYSGTDPIGFVLAKNIHRRHLNASQRALVATRLEELYAVEAKERQRAAGGDNRRGAKALPANLPDAAKAAKGAREKAAIALNVSPRLVQDAKKVSRKGAPEVIKAVRDGELPVSVAAKLTRETPKVQTKVVAAVVSGKKASAAMAEVKAPDLCKAPPLSNYATRQQAVIAAHCARIKELQEEVERASSAWTKYDAVGMKAVIRSANRLSRVMTAELAVMSGWCRRQSSQSLAGADASPTATPASSASKKSPTKKARGKRKASGG